MWLFRSGIVIAIYTALCLYTGSRMFRFFQGIVPGCRVAVFWPLYILVCFAFILAGLSGLDALNPVRLFCMYFMAAFVYFLLFTIAFDVLRLLFRLALNRPAGPRFFAAGMGAVLCLTLLVIFCGALHARRIQVKNYSITIGKEGPAGGARIVLVSDLHIGGTVNRAWIARIMDAVNRARPGMVCIAGDIFDGNLDMVQDMDGIAAELRRLEAPLGVYACLGNHDVDRVRLFQDSGSTGRIEAFLKSANIVLLRDEALPVTEGLYVAGRLDARPIGMRQSRKSIAELAAPLDKNAAILLLDHQPLEFPQAEAAGVDLLLCGHTHKGQMFPGNLITRRIFRKAGGTHYGYWRGANMQAVVTSGAGVWGPPVRIATDSEIAVLDLQFAGLSPR